MRDTYLYQLLRELGLTDFGARTVSFLLVHVLKIALIVVVAYIGARILTRLVRRSVHAFATRSPLTAGSARAELRAATIGGVASSVVRIVIWTIAALLVIQELGFDLTPFLAGASVVGVALGFGAQSLVRDFLSGFFILVEDQYGVGDTVTVAETSGTVEEVNLRVTRLRADDGTVWFVPNGEIHTVGRHRRGRESTGGA
jgi:small conductance mechanosensitive channel